MSSCHRSHLGLILVLFSTRLTALEYHLHCRRYLLTYSMQLIAGLIAVILVDRRYGNEQKQLTI